MRNGRKIAATLLATAGAAVSLVANILGSAGVVGFRVAEGDNGIVDAAWRAATNVDVPELLQEAGDEAS